MIKTNLILLIAFSTFTLVTYGADKVNKKTSKHIDQKEVVHSELENASRIYLECTNQNNVKNHFLISLDDKTVTNVRSSYTYKLDISSNFYEWGEESPPLEDDVSWTLKNKVTYTLNRTTGELDYIRQRIYKPFGNGTTDPPLTVTDFADCERLPEPPTPKKKF